MLKKALTQIIINSVMPKTKELLIKAKNGYEWKKMFAETGEFLSNDSENSDRFHEDLMVVFSKRNMRKMAKDLKNQSGYRIKDSLKKQLVKLMEDYEIDSIDADSFSNHFIDIILNYYEKNMPDEYNKYYLADWRSETQEKLEDIFRVVNEINNKYVGREKKECILTLEQVNSNLNRETDNPMIGLDFFEIDDEEFLEVFFDRIEEEKIYVVGRSREETIYSLLNEINKRDVDRLTLIVANEEGWEDLSRSDLKNAILIPTFNAETITAISNNTNIFVYGFDIPCHYHEKIELRKRTMKSIIDSLENAGLNYKEAYKLAMDSHGLYVPMKKRIFNGAMYTKPEWAECPSDIIITALLCGKWTNLEGDKQVIEKISGVDYEEYIKQLSRYKKRDNPFVVEVNGFRGKSMQLASVEDAWVELNDYITDDIWDSFVDSFLSNVIKCKSQLDYPAEKSLKENTDNSEKMISETMKSGMIRSLIMKAYFIGEGSSQYRVNNIVEKVLKKVNTIEAWNYIAQFLPDLCEAAPSVVMKRLEREIKNSTGLIELFKDINGDIIIEKNNYTGILWAVEQLIQEKEYVIRAINWLWEMNSLNITYNLSNSPSSVLETAFFAGLNLCAMNADNKINQAKCALEKYDYSWDIIYSELPSIKSFVWSSLNTPMYRMIEEPEELSDEDIRKTYVQYFEECIKHIDESEVRWNKIIDIIGVFSEVIQKTTFEKLISDVANMNDEQRITIKNNLRAKVYSLRYYLGKNNTSIQESNANRLEVVMKKIKTNNPVYEYLYLFTNKYEFPLINPIPFKKQGFSNIREMNNKLMEKEIKTKVEEFQKERLSIKELLELSSKNHNSTVGEYIAKYYGDKKYSKDILWLMLDINSCEKIIFDYVRHFSLSNEKVIEQAVGDVKEKTENDKLIVELLRLESIDKREKTLITRQSDSIKRLYWNSNVKSLGITDKKTFKWAIGECKKYGSINTYLEILFDAKEVFSVEEIFYCMIKIEEFEQTRIDQMSQYYLEKLLKKIQGYAMRDEGKSIKIKNVEWLFKNKLNWEDMIFTQYWIKKTPDVYAELVDCIYHKEGESKKTSDAGKKKKASEYFDLYYKAHFCPADKDGNVDYEELCQWLRNFKNLLIKQKQEKLFGYLVGRLFAYSPVGKDNYMPSEAVRDVIEEMDDESIKQSYAMAEENKRGVYSPDAGKTELEMSRNYKENAEAIRDNYPKTAQIFDLISEHYATQSKRERELAAYEQ